MKHAPCILIGLVLLGFCMPARAQTAPMPLPKAQPDKSASHPTGTPAQQRTDYAPIGKIDTAAFRRSGRPADQIKTRVRQKQ